MKKLLLGLLSLLIILGACSKKEEEVINDEIPEDLYGLYYDSIAGRGELELSKNDDGALINIRWSSSANESAFWEMNATYNASENKLNYKDGKLTYIIFTSDTESTEEVKYTDGSGYFEVKDNTLVWYGDKQEDNSETIFIKNEYQEDISLPWREFDNLEDAIKDSGVELSGPEEVVIKDLNLVFYKYVSLPEVIGAYYENINDELIIMKSSSDSLRNINEGNTYSKNWTEVLKGLSVDCFGDGTLINEAYFNFGDNYYSITFNKGYEGQGITIDQISSLVNSIQ